MMAYDGNAYSQFSICSCQCGFCDYDKSQTACRGRVVHLLFQPATKNHQTMGCGMNLCHKGPHSAKTAEGAKLLTVR